MKIGKKVLLNTVIYTVSGLLLKCFSLFFLPLYTSFLTTEDYGITSISQSFIMTMSFVVAFSLFSAVMRFYVDLVDEPEKLKRFYGTVIVFIFLSGAFFGAVFYLAKPILCKHVFSGVPFFPIVFVSIISLIFSCQHSVYEAILRSQQKALKCAMLVIIYFFTSLLLNIFFVVNMRMGALGVILATMIANVLYTVYFIIDMVYHKDVAFCLDMGLLKDALKYSIPIMPHNLSTRIAEFVSKILIGSTASLANLGIYSVASQFANMADTIQVYFNNAYAPWLYEKLHSKETGYKQEINSVVNMLCGLMGIFFLGIAFFSQDYILLFIDKSYADAWKYISFIVTIYCVKTIYYFYMNVLLYHKKASRLIFIATLSGSLINVLFSSFLIPLFNVYGSILADGAAILVCVTIIVCISLKFEDIGLRIRDFIKNIMVVVLFMGIGLFPSFLKNQNEFSLINFLYKSAIVVMYTIFILSKYRSRIYAFLKRKLERKSKNEL